MGRHRAEGPGGEIVWMEWSDRALFDADWKVREFQSVGRDITESVRMEEWVRRIHGAESAARTSAAIAHDLRSVFQVLLLQLDPRLPASAEARLQSIRRAVNQGADLLEQLRELRYGQVERYIPGVLARRVEELLPLLRDMAGSRVHIEMRLADVPCVITGNPTQIDQILLNLVGNAAEAAKTRCTVTLSTHRDPIDSFSSEHRWTRTRPAECCVLRVADEAGGIDAGILPRLFETNVSTKGDGRGLGLATVKAIVEAHQGSIAVATNPMGTMFEVAFPVSSAA
jgi:signal transduction histidine kinase